MAAAIIVIVVLTTVGTEQAKTTGYTYTGGTGQDIVLTGEQYLGESYSYWSCAEFTQAAVAGGVGVNIPSDPVGQFYSGWEPRNMKPGDLMFFNEHGTGISHVGIYVGGYTILHSSDYFWAVVESDYRYIDGFVGVRRIR